MLCSLTIQNIALIDKAFIDFQDGFTTLTGETGAGKSIIIDAVNLVLGERADRDLIRTGEEFAEVDALFLVGGREEKALEEMGIETENGEVVLSRRITRAGRSTCRINGSLVTLAQMQTFTSLLVDIHGQHDHQSLLREEKHAAYLDAYAQKELAPLLEKIAGSYRSFLDIRQKMRRLSQNSRENERLKDMLAYEIAEIDAVHLKDGEEEELAGIRDKNRNAEKILSSLHTAQDAFSGESRGILEQIQRASGALEGIREILPEYQELYNSVQEIYYLAQDAGYTLRDTLDSLDFDPNEADRVEQRLDTIHVLEKKYGSTIAEILQWRQEAGEKLSEMENAQENLEEYQQQLRTERRKLFALCEDAHKVRMEAARKFEKEVLRELKDLGMERADFSVDIQSPSSLKEAESLYTATGFDHVRFLLTVNPGEPKKPLSKTASGGEMSRIMLAFKTVLALTDEIPTLIFDEIDTGISGRMAQVVAEKMARIGMQRQVLCVTHLPQIAAMGDRQLMVEKTFEEDKTITRTVLLEGEARSEEISRMVSGAGDALSGLAHARNLLESAEKWKAQAR